MARAVTFQGTAESMCPAGLSALLVPTLTSHRGPSSVCPSLCSTVPSSRPTCYSGVEQI